MSEYAIIDNLSAESWESFLDDFPDGTFEQCFAYNEISKLAYPSTKSIRLAIKADGDLAGVVQGTYSRYFGFGMSLRIMGGPIIDTTHEESPRLVENLINALEENGKRQRIIRLELLVPEKWKMQQLLSKLSYSPSGELNGYFINLKDMDELWKKIDHNKRRNITKAINEDVKIVQSDDYEDVLTFYSMLEASAKRQGFVPYPLSWFDAVWKLYEPGKLSQVFLAHWKGKPVSGVFVVTHGKTVYALAAGSFKKGWKSRPNDLIHWKIMEWANQNGYSKYNMGLIDEPLPTENSCAWGIWRWKKEWNGNLERIKIFTKFLLPRYKIVFKTKKLIECVFRS
jgi:hypothetical protein